MHVLGLENGEGGGFSWYRVLVWRLVKGWLLLVHVLGVEAGVGGGFPWCMCLIWR